MIYETNYKRLLKIVPGLLEMAEDGEAKSKRLKAEGFMDLHVEFLYKRTPSCWAYSLAHYGEQNGDMMKDPDMEIWVYPELEMVEAFNFQNDYVGVYRQVRFTRNGQEFVRPQVKKELNSFLRTWTLNLKRQGHKEAKEEK
jgi:uncharacterized protein YqiB (DUF1249 family)